MIHQLLRNSIRMTWNTVDNFIKGQAQGGVVLVFLTVFALVWANGSYQSTYHELLHLSIGFHLGGFEFDRSVLHWVNEAFMAFFFLLVGLEVKREFCAGELNTIQKALLPVVAAAFGMLLPALIFLGVNIHHPQNYQGWAIPSATDIAFSLGILSLFRKKIPKNVFILLATIAIVDDIGAVVVISFFYTKNIHFMDLLWALFTWVSLFVLNMLRVQKLFVYLLLGGILWGFLLNSGIHASIAGVLLAFAIPLFNFKLEKSDAHSQTLLVESISPLQRLENSLHMPVNYFVIPLFILFNAGISLGDLMPHGASMTSIFLNPLTLGVLFGLWIGKPLGIFLPILILTRLGWASLPNQTRYSEIFLMACLTGIGFTMAIFIADLAFLDPKSVGLCKVGILLGSLFSVILATGVGIVMPTQKRLNSQPR